MIKMAYIPARYAATRFPFKLMQLLGNKTVIRHTYDNTVATSLFDDVVVVTDHELIYNEIKDHGGKVVMSIRNHESGSDRIAEAIESLDVDVVVNVQGDEPFVSATQLSALLDVFETDETKKVQVASLMKKITDDSMIQNPNIVKVVAGANGDALYFSREAIPYNRSGSALFFEHIGVYAYRKDALLLFTKLPASALEKTEMLEQLRYLENGIHIRMIETDKSAIKIDMPADLQKATEYLLSLQPK
ncbi:MAG: 3-deoxy-manno-octulosonate cytidylyltransferase [Ferruginibacter sp.]